MAALTEDTIEETNADVPDFMGVEGEQFEFYDLDSEDDELEFVHSFV